MTVREAIQQAARSIPRRDAERLLLHVLSQQRPWLLAHPEADLPPSSLATFEDLVARRAAHEPVQYLVGHQEFYGLDLRVTPDTLIPRPETELLVEAVLDWCTGSLPEKPQARIRMADVGTGTGAIAIALAVHLPLAQIRALDLSPATRAALEANAARHGVSGRVVFTESDLLDGLANDVAHGPPLDVVVSNPPYVPLADAPGLEPEVRDFEPHLALFAGEDGLAVYRRLIPQARAALRPGGLLALEFGFGQQPAITGLLDGWENVHFRNDLAGIPRVALAERP
jgi:release factor glutamine methyltransferase